MSLADKLINKIILQESEASIWRARIRELVKKLNAVEEENRKLKKELEQYDRPF